MTKATRRKSGFTLVEVLIVVVIMAILAGTIIPQFTDSTLDAKKSSATFNLHTLRQQIELYKSQHDGALPKLTTPNLLVELTSSTDKNGAIGTTAGVHIYGPYLKAIPANPFTGVNQITAVSGTPAAGDKTVGWFYDSNTGSIWASFDPANATKAIPFNQQ